MSKDLDFGDGTWEEAGGTVRGKLDEFNVLLNGNGEEGLVTVVAGYRAQLRLIVWMIGTAIILASVIATIFGIWLNNIDQRHKFGDAKDQSSLQSQQDSAIPKVR